LAPTTSDQGKFSIAFAIPGGIVASRNGFPSLTVQKNQPDHVLFLTHMNSRMILRLRVLHASLLLRTVGFQIIHRTVNG
jgi:hypothetical protein